ncbi:hypothetical protein [uncultured Aureimonas sp.]|uniref:hypothetical protein n=1 Tax=uncultured Aureimonas sp. TaxID=1604662 RepID=UPI0025E661BF|nr:hypothetical protein [uncultured Aureimonas sp.]
MAKNHGPSRTSGLGSAGHSKRGRNAVSGQFLEVTVARSRPKTAVVEGGTAKGNPMVLRTDRVIRSVTSGAMVEAVMHAAADEGLTVSKDGRIAGRVSSELIAKAKARTGITSDTELLEFALASVAIDDKFAEAFHAVRGTVDPDLDFGF